MKYLVPVARVNGEHCERLAAALVEHRCDTRQAGQLYAAWREGAGVARERILAQPELFLKTQRQAPATRPAAAALERDLEMAIAILQRAGRRLAEALSEMDGQRQEQAQRQIEGARHELDRMEQRIGKEQRNQHAEPSAANHDAGTECEGRVHTRDRTRVEAVALGRTQNTAIELHPGAGKPKGGESRTLPATDSGSFDFLQGQSRASPWR
jgi:hypothetical protein